MLLMYCFWWNTPTYLPNVFFHMSNMHIKRCWVLWFFLKPVNRFESLSFMKLSTWMYTTLSKTFGTWDKTLTDLFFSRSSLFLKTRLILANFRSSGKQLFSKDKFIFLIIKGRCISKVDVSISTRIRATRVVLKLSRF